MPLVWTTMPHYEQNDEFSPMPLAGFGRSKSTPRTGIVSSSEDDDPLGKHGTEIRRHRMQKLMSTVEELNKAMESFVVSVVVDPDDANSGFSSYGENDKKDIQNDNQNFGQRQLTAN